MENPVIIHDDVSQLQDRFPTHAIVENTDLVIVKFDDKISVLYGRCLHRGALMSDGHIDGNNLICGLHNWDYRIDSGVSEYDNKEVLNKFRSWIENGDLYVDQNEIIAFEEMHPQPFDRKSYLGTYADTHPESTEPYTGYIKELARNGLNNYGHHGPSASMGVDRNTLPKWEEIQFLPPQLAVRPLLDEEAVITDTIIGPSAKKPLILEKPFFVSDMSFGSLSREAKIALALGAEMSSTGICSRNI